jgi:hypothetical protein
MVTVSQSRLIDLVQKYIDISSSAEHRECGQKHRKLLTYSSTKIEHSNEYGAKYLTAIMYLAPAMVSGRNVCAWKTAGCETVCLNTAGRGVMSTVQAARIGRTHHFQQDRVCFKVQLYKEITAHIRKALKLGRIPALRLNGTSDITWEKLPIFSDMFQHFSGVVFYDYTKYPIKYRSELPSNYSLTYSRSERPGSDLEAVEWAQKGYTAAVVFDTKRGAPLPATWQGLKVIDADVHDMRFLESGTVAGLRAKGKARKDSSGFVVKVAA